MPENEPSCPATPKMGAWDLEFHQLFMAFVEAGGLDSTARINEQWERELRTAAYCGHSIMRQKCEHCRKTLPQYGQY